MTPSAEVMNETGLQAITGRILAAIRNKAANQVPEGLSFSRSIPGRSLGSST